MKSKYCAAVILAALGGGTGLARAEEGAQGQGFYVGLVTGSMRNADKIVGGRDVYLGYLAGYRFSKEWSAEVTAAGGLSCFLHVFANAFDPRCEALDRHIGAYGLYHVPVSGDFKFYGRLGLGSSRIETANRNGRSHYSRYEAGLGGGLAYEPWPSLTLRLDVNRLTRTKATSLSLQGIWNF